jgi:autotransporter-associated beta strand protein
LVPFKGTGVTTIPGHLIIGNSGGLIVPTATVQHFSGFTINGSVTVNRGGLWDLNGQAEGFSIPALEGRPPLTLNNGGDVQTGSGFIYLPVGGDVIVNPGSFIGANSFISGNIGLDPGPHHFVVGSGISFFGGLELDVPAIISQTSTAADIVKDGIGQMKLSGNNSFTGAVAVNAGTLILSNKFALGTSAGGTTVNTNASLVLDGGGLLINNESLTLNSSNAAALSCNSGSNTWSGPITLSRDTTIAVNPAGGYLQAMNTVSGPGALTKIGAGTLQFWGSTANTYGGLTTVAQGTLEAGRVNLTSIPGNVVIGDDSTSTTTATLRSLREQQFLRTADITVHGSGLLDLFPFPAVPVPQPTLRRVAGGGKLILGTGTSLTISNEISGVFDGAVSGAGALNKRGIATLRFTGDGSTYTGAATVFDGTYKVDGYFPSSPVTVKNSSILRGSGTVGDVTVENGGDVQVDPILGQLGGTLQMNSANFQNGGVLGLQFYGPHPTAGNDNLVVNNSVMLTSPTLSSGFLYPPHEGDILTIIHKSAAGAVSGTFSGIPEGTVKQIGNIPVVVSYVGGDGNDVTLTVTGLPLQGGGSQIVSGNFGSVLVPHDCSQLFLIVTNRGSTTVTNLRGTLRSLTDGVLVTIPESAFPNLAPNASGTNLMPFQVRTEPTFPCGSGAQFELVLTSSNLPTTAITYTLFGGSGYGLDFDGGDDRAQARTNIFFTVTNNFTIELWANPTANRAESAEVNSGISVVFHQAQRFAVFPDQSDLSYGFGHVGAGLSIGKNGISVFEQASNYFPSPLVYSNDISGWTHVALVYVNRRPRLYINGALARTGLLSAAPFIHACDSLGGSIHGFGLGNFKGQLDEVRIWNSALSQTQIQTNMNRSLTGTESGLIVYFRCDEGTGNLLTDSAPASPNNSSVLTNGAEFSFPGAVPFPQPGVDCNSGGGGCESCTVVTGQFTTNTPTSAQRLFFIGDPSICFPAKPCPDLDPTPDLSPVRNIVHSFVNNTTNQLCVTAVLQYDCPSAVYGTLGVAAYLGSFNPDQPCATYLGDIGFGGPPYPPFSFSVPAGSNFVVVVTARETNLICDTYALRLFSLPCPPPTLAISRETAPNRVRVDWSTAYPGWTAQSSPTIIGNYSDVPLVPAMVNGRYALTNLPATNNNFFRLHQP